MTEDIKARALMGKEKYGVYLQANNGRYVLMDLEQELIDAVLYLRQKRREDELERIDTIDKSRP